MSLFILIASLVTALAAPEPTVLVDQSFTLHAPGDEAGQAMGLYSMNATQEANQIKITESVELRSKRGTVDMTSIVIYEQGDNKAWVFQAATAVTGVDGNIVMQVSVLPTGQKWAVTTTFLREQDGEAFDEPKTAKRTIEVPKGPVLFASARAVMGPRLQPKPGKLPIVWVEFPDDIDEDINVKDGFSLVRDEPDAEGEFMIWITSENQTIGPLPLTAEGKIVPHKLWDKMLMCEE